MIGKIVTGKSFGGAVEYILKKEKARLLDSDGVDISSIRSIIDDLNFQRKTRPEIAKVVGHISLAFHKADAPKLTDEFMTILAQVYMERMGITDTQYIVARHNDTEHPHLHIIYNRVRYDKKLVPDKHERRRNVKVCKELKMRYGLTFSKGKENVKVEKLHAQDKVKYAIYKAIKSDIPHCSSPNELAARLQVKGIKTAFIHRGGDPTKDIQGITFTKDGLTLKGSQVDRKFSYAGIVKALRQDTERVQVEERRHITEIKGYKLTPDEQKQLYSPDGLTLTYEEKDWQYTSRFGVKQIPDTEDILTEYKQASEKINRNPVIFGIQLTDEQIATIKEGEPIYLRGMRNKGQMLDGYLVMTDTLEYGRIFTKEDPRAWVKYGKYEMRLMDKILIEAGYITRAVVKWWGGMGQTARPYLWKQNPTDTEYKENWDDPRKPQLRPKVKTCEPTQPKQKKGRGV